MSVTSEKPLEQITGEVTHIKFQSDNFTIGTIITQSGRITFLGNIIVNVDDRVILSGQWKHHSTYGKQFEVTFMEYDMGLNTGGLAHWIANNGNIRGIGRVKAKKLVELYGENLLEKIKVNPETAAAKVGVPRSSIDQLINTLETNFQTLQVKTWLSNFGLTFHQTEQLISRYGNSTKSILEKNPYEIIKEIRGYGFRKIDDIALKMGISKEHSGRINRGILYALEQELEKGHCWAEYNQVIELANKILILDCENALDVIENHLDGLIENGELVLHNAGQFLVALPWIKEQEDYIRDFLQLSPYTIEVKTALDKAREAHETLSFTAGQLRAFCMATQSNVCLISGGAGTGKTWILKQIIECYKKAYEILDQEIDILCCAPTGKAARRIEESTGQETYTIHRALGYNPQFGWEYNEENKLPFDLVIVDEISMMDVTLAWRLFQAIDPQRTPIILVGDHNQLPPVGAGNLLRDIVQGHLCPMVILDQCVRQAGTLKECSNAILRGVVRESSSDESWWLYNNFETPEECSRKIYEIFLHCLIHAPSNGKSKNDRQSIIETVQVLTPTKKGPLGTIVLNNELQRIVQRFLYSRDAITPHQGKISRPLLGDKVIQTRNNYDLDVYNGTIGIVIDINEKPFRYIVRWEDGKEKIIKGDSIGDIQLAYALTVHKSQGSEWPYVILVTHSSHFFMHTRNLIYTGVTRAREISMLVGDRRGPIVAVKKEDVNKRRTFLSLAGRV